MWHQLMYDKYMKKIFSEKFPYFSLGLAILILSNPFLYLMIAATFIDIQNLFGANIDRRSISYSSEDPFIQAMNFVGFLGFFIIILGYLRGRIKHLF